MRYGALPGKPRSTTESALGTDAAASDAAQELVPRSPAHAASGAVQRKEDPDANAEPGAQLPSTVHQIKLAERKLKHGKLSGSFRFGGADNKVLKGKKDDAAGRLDAGGSVGQVKNQWSLKQVKKLLRHEDMIKQLGEAIEVQVAGGELGSKLGEKGTALEGLKIAGKAGVGKLSEGGGKLVQVSIEVSGDVTKFIEHIGEMPPALKGKLKIELRASYSMALTAEDAARWLEMQAAKRTLSQGADRIEVLGNQRQKLRSKRRALRKQRKALRRSGISLKQRRKLERALDKKIHKLDKGMKALSRSIGGEDRLGQDALRRLGAAKKGAGQALQKLANKLLRESLQKVLLKFLPFVGWLDTAYDVYKIAAWILDGAETGNGDGDSSDDKSEGEDKGGDASAEGDESAGDGDGDGDGVSVRQHGAKDAPSGSDQTSTDESGPPGQPARSPDRPPVDQLHPKARAVYEVLKRPGGDLAVATSVIEQLNSIVPEDLSEDELATLLDRLRRSSDLGVTDDPFKAVAPVIVELARLHTELDQTSGGSGGTQAPEIPDEYSRMPTDEELDKLSPAQRRMRHKRRDEANPKPMGQLVRQVFMFPEDGSVDHVYHDPSAALATLYDPSTGRGGSGQVTLAPGLVVEVTRVERKGLRTYGPATVHRVRLMMIPVECFSIEIWDAERYAYDKLTPQAPTQWTVDLVA